MRIHLLTVFLCITSSATAAYGTSVAGFLAELPKPNYVFGWVSDLRPAYLIGLFVTLLVAVIVCMAFYYRTRLDRIDRSLNETENEKQCVSHALEKVGSDLAEAQSSLAEFRSSSEMAHHATGALHDVGNVLNSLSVSIDTIRSKFERSKLDGLSKVVDLFAENSDDLGRFFSEDARAEKILDYLRSLKDTLIEDQSTCAQELAEAISFLEHAKRIVLAQQSKAREAMPAEEISLMEIVKAASKIGIPSDRIGSVGLELDVPTDMVVALDHHALLQVFANFIKNSAEAVFDQGIEDGRIGISARSLEEDSSRIEIFITDNGCGIDPSDSNRIFEKGFTTKPYGHGFGLDSAMVALRSMNGEVSLISEGVGRGAIARLVLPKALS